MNSLGDIRIFLSLVPKESPCIIMGPLSYIRSVVNRNVVMRRIPVFQFVRGLLASDSRTSGDRVLS
jgi:hypothetical protein